MDRLRKQMDFILEADKLKNIVRQSYIADGSRKETDTDHSWHLALMCMILKDYSNEEIDVLKVLNMVLIHDIIEIDAGDTYAYDTVANESKREREVKAADRIFGILPEDQEKEFRDLWEEFEEGKTPEAKFALTLDKIQPLLLNHITGGRAWREHEVEQSQIWARNKYTGQGSEELWNYCKELINKNIEKGNIKRGKTMEEKDMIEKDMIEERYDLSVDRIRDILKETTVREPYLDYFHKVSSFILMIHKHMEERNHGQFQNLSIEELEHRNYQLYEDILEGNYETSYANPAYAVKVLGEEYGRELSFLYTEIRGLIVYAYENRIFDITIHNEVFIEVYNCFEEGDVTKKQIQEILYWFVSDYSDVTLEYRIREQIDPSLSFAVDIIMNSDLTDLRYLYEFGEYITENELETAKHLNSLSQDQIEKMAFTYTEGYRIGFVKGNKDLSKKETVNIRYSVGFERIIREAIKQFEKLGLKTTIYRAAINTINKKQHYKIGYYSTPPNKQYDYDHKADNAIYLDKAFVTRKLGVLKVAYEKYKELAGKFAGPAVMEIFGEKPFIPKATEEAYTLSDKQQKLSVNYDNEAGQIVNEYIKGEERSFTIIAYPIPEIGKDFKAIFDETVKINTLDYTLYETIQQHIIDALDQGEYVHIKGKGSNQTDMKVSLYALRNPEKETIFENCVADVNIPVGEVFTSPVLKGTTGRIHVSQVYLNELKYLDLSLDFKDGMVVDYNCKNFDTEEENKKYIKDNIMYHHETLPLGEFAIGTNTTAYVMAKKYQIADKLPILIAEKMGPHFAVGDTCYSWAEENKIYNPDGKEIVARDNEVSILRKEDISKAYVNCHTDVTIPYDELEELSVVGKNGLKIAIIKDGRFVLEGTEELNKPFYE